ncbi:MAG: hypothetical protein QM737_01420 [Ferruginibacter sp.]
MEVNLINTIPQLSIKRLMDYYIAEGSVLEGSFQASAFDPVILIESNLKDPANRYIDLKYEANDDSGFIECRIDIVAVKSNLPCGGNCLFFLCPKTGTRCRILYLCDKTNLYVSREAFENRLYYPLQIIGKRFRLDMRSDLNDEKLLEAFFNLKRQTYLGKKTRVNVAIDKMMDKRRTLNLLIKQQFQQRLAAWEKGIEPLFPEDRY